MAFVKVANHPDTVDTAKVVVRNYVGASTGFDRRRHLVAIRQRQNAAATT